MNAACEAAAPERDGAHAGALSAYPRIGTLLAGRYRVERWLGAGGMGVVVGARDLELDRLVAVKLLHGGRTHAGPSLARFRREARAAGIMKSEHAVRVFDVGLLETGAPYIIMEHLEGEDLADVIRRRGRLPVHECVDLVLQACEALAEAHVQGVVHRDLKPANLFLASRPDGTSVLKVLDFGISKIASASGAHRDVETLTETDAPSTTDRHAWASNAEKLAKSASPLTAPRTMLGSPRYMAPEQIVDAHDVDARADVWALGAVLYELITGRPPFIASGRDAALREVRESDAPKLRSIRRDVALSLERATLRCLAKDREDRWPDVAAFAAAIAPFGSEGARPAARRVASLIHREAVATERKNGRVLAWGGLLLVAAASLVGGTVWAVAPRHAALPAGHRAPRALDDETRRSSEVRARHDRDPEPVAPIARAVSPRPSARPTTAETEAAPTQRHEVDPDALFDGRK